MPKFELIFEPKSLCIGFAWNIVAIERIQSICFQLPFWTLKISFSRTFYHAISLPQKRILVTIAVSCGGVIEKDKQRCGYIARFDSFDAAFHFYWLCCNLFPKDFGKQNYY